MELKYKEIAEIHERVVEASNRFSNEKEKEARGMNAMWEECAAIQHKLIIDLEEMLKKFC